MKSLHRLLLVLVSVLALSIEPVNSKAQAPEIDAFFGFGDSLSDTGNLWLLTQAVGQDPAVPPSVSPHMTYFNRRFSNGPVAIEYLWNHITSNAGDEVTPFLAALRVPQKGAVSFAFGASGTGFIESIPGPLLIPGLNGQVELFDAALRGRKPPRRALYVIFTGANDYLGGPGVALAPQVVVGNIVNAIQKLYALGARDVMVLNLPNLGLIPLVPDGLKPTLTGLTVWHNFLLAQALTGLAAGLPDLRLIPVDVFTFSNNLAALPGADLNPALPFPLSHCLFINPASCTNAGTFDVDPKFFFWDAEHPSTATHAALGALLFSKLPEE